MSKMVRFRREDIPPISKERLTEMAEDAKTREIDLSDPDASELGEAQWADAVRGRFYRPVKEQVTTKLDRDVVAWLKKDGPGYQTRMNAILRQAMLGTFEQDKAA